MQIKTDRLILRELKGSDEKDIQRNANNIKIAKYIAPFPHPYSIKDAKNFIKSCIKHSRDKPREVYDFGITLKSEDKVIGIISISKVDRFQGTCSIGYWLAQPYWRNGYMYESLRASIEFAFKKIKLRRIGISALADNEASNALIKKTGFKYEGTKIKESKDKATKRIHDHHFYGMLKENWNKLTHKSL